MHSGRTQRISAKKRNVSHAATEPIAIQILAQHVLATIVTKRTGATGNGMLTEVLNNKLTFG